MRSHAGSGTKVGITPYKLARLSMLAKPRHGRSSAGERTVTADPALRLSKGFGLTGGFWTSLQKDYEVTVAKG
jgi:plasmid maintenance system antidote protein VapI